jgi:sulfite exporter TauE/SafE
MPANVPIGLKILLGLGTILMIIGIIYFYIGYSVAKEAILSFDKGIAFFIIGIAVLICTLMIIVIVDIEEIKGHVKEVKEELDQIISK